MATYQYHSNQGVDDGIDVGPNMMTLFLTSNALQQSRPGNTSMDFTTDIPGRPLLLKGDWSVCLIDITYAAKTRRLNGRVNVMSDICVPSLAGSRMLPVLRQLNVSAAAGKKRNDKVSNPCYVPLLTRNPITSIRIYIRSTDDEITTDFEGTVSCTLQLVRTG